MTEARHCPFCEVELPERKGPGRPRVYCSNACRQRKYMAGIRYNGVSLLELCERDGSCYICGGALDLTIKGGPWSVCHDHIIPVSRGGLSTIENLAAVHLGCNARKGDRLLDPSRWPAA